MTPLVLGDCLGPHPDTEDFRGEGIVLQEYLLHISVNLLRVKRREGKEGGRGGKGGGRKGEVMGCGVQCGEVKLTVLARRSQ